MVRPSLREAELALDRPLLALQFLKPFPRIFTNGRGLVVESFLYQLDLPKKKIASFAKQTVYQGSKHKQPSTFNTSTFWHKSQSIKVMCTHITAGV